MHPQSRRPAAGSLLFLLVLVSFVIGRPATPSGQPQAEGFTLAVVRRDAIALPIATYDGKRWKNAWPRPQSKVTAPIGLIDVPSRWWSGRAPITRWTFWPIQGQSREIETLGPVSFPAHCSQGVGLRTSYTPAIPPPPLNARPYPKDGLAASGAASITPFEILDAPSAPLARELEQSLPPQVVEDESKYIKVLSPWRHPYDEEERRATPIKIEAVYRVARGLGDRDVYYFEGFKHYAVRMPPQTGGQRDRPPLETPASATPARATADRDAERANQPGAPRTADGGSPASPSPAPSATAKKPVVVPACDLVTFVSGWFIRRGDDKSKITPLQLNVVPTSCDFAGAQILLPLAVVHVRDKALWVVQWSGRRQEFYAVLDVEEDQVRQVAWAGGGGCTAPD